MITDRNLVRKITDFVFFPIRAILVFENDLPFMTSLRSERFLYAKEHTRGYTLDIGCGPNNIFISEFLKNEGVGIDIYPYEGLREEQIFDDLSVLPFKDATFDTVTLIANLNHIPSKLRLSELAEAHRVLGRDGRILITMGAPWAEVLVHYWVALFDRLFSTNYDRDSERGMAEGEEYYVRDSEIRELLRLAHFRNIRREYFWTQWCLNKIYVATKS